MKGPVSKFKSTPVLCVMCALVLGCADRSDDPPSRAECDRYRAHAIDLRLAAADKPGIPDEALASHRRQLSDAIGPALLDRCEHEFTHARFTCALAATTQEALNRCADISEGK